MKDKKPLFANCLRFQNGSNKVAIELQVVQFWSEIILLSCDFKPNSRCALIWFWNQAYDFRPNCTPLSSIAIMNECFATWLIKLVFSGMEYSPSAFVCNVGCEILVQSMLLILILFCIEQTLENEPLQCDIHSCVSFISHRSWLFPTEALTKVGGIVQQFN